MCAYKYAHTPHSSYSHVQCPLVSHVGMAAMREGRSRALRIGAVCMENTLFLRDLRLRNTGEGRVSGAWSIGTADGVGGWHDQGTLNQAPTPLYTQCPKGWTFPCPFCPIPPLLLTQVENEQSTYKKEPNQIKLTADFSPATMYARRW